MLLLQIQFDDLMKKFLNILCIIHVNNVLCQTYINLHIYKIKYTHIFFLFNFCRNIISKHASICLLVLFTTSVFKHVLMFILKGS